MKLCCVPFNLGMILFLACGFCAQAGNVFVSNSGNGTIVQLDSSGNESVFASGLNSPAGLAFDNSGNLYVADSGDGTILRFNSSGIGSLFASGLNDPTGLAFGNNGDLYVASQGDGTILQFNSSGQKSVFASGLNNPTYLAFDNDNLYASTPRTIEEFDSNGNQSAIFSAFNYVYGIAADNNGDLYASLQNAGSITRVLGNSGPQTPFSYPYSVNPFELAPAGLAFDGNGNLYATFSQLGYFGANGGNDVLNGVVMEFDSSGNGSILTTGLNSPEYIVVQNTLTMPPVQFVPEPSTWALMLAGVGLLIGYRFHQSLPLCVTIRARQRSRDDHRRRH